MRKAPVILLLIAALFPIAIPRGSFASEPLLRPEDRIAWVGGTFVERMQFSGMVEAELQCRRPEWRLRVRNLGWSGDDVTAVARKVFGEPPEGMERLLSDLQVADPTVVILAYGFAEAGDERWTVETFEAAYRHLIDRLSQRPAAEQAGPEARQNDQANPAAERRLILVQPLAMPGYRRDDYSESLADYRDAVERIGNDLSLPVLDAPWPPSAELLEWNQLLPSPAGYQHLARAYADQLVGGVPCESIPAELPRQIAAKNELFFHRHRPQNETYLFLFRKHEQGNNAVEIPRFDPLIQAADEKIWAAAR